MRRKLCQHYVYVYFLTLDRFIDKIDLNNAFHTLKRVEDRREKIATCMFGILFVY